MEVGKVDLIWLISGVTVLQEENTPLVLLADEAIRRKSAGELDSILLLIQNASSSIIRGVTAQGEGSPVACLERIDLLSKDINPHDSAGMFLYFKQKRVRICEKKVEIGERIQISGKLVFSEEAIPVKNTNVFISLTDKQGCILHGHVEQSKTNAEGEFQTGIEILGLGWHLRSVHLTFYTEFRLELTFKYTENNEENSSKKTVITSCDVDDSVPTMEELEFNFDQLQAEIWELKDLEEECKWEWSMVPMIRKQQEKPSSILTNCEICKKHIGVGKKRFRQCSHCGRWIGVKCDSCWDNSTIFKRTHCIICADIHRRSLEAIRENEPKR